MAVPKWRPLSGPPTSQGGSGSYSGREGAFFVCTGWKRLSCHLLLEALMP